MQHMTPYREITQHFTATSKQIATAGNHILRATGEGNTIVMDQLQLTNILLTPDLQDSLFSIAAVNDHGYDITFNHNGVVTILDGNTIIAEGYREGNLYYLQLSSQTPIEDSLTDEHIGHTLKANTLPMSNYQL